MPHCDCTHDLRSLHHIGMCDRHVEPGELCIVCDAEEWVRRRTETADGQPRCQRCGRVHRQWWKYAACVLHPCEWTQGRGPWASVADCPRGRTAILRDTEAEARQLKEWVDATRCGGACIGNHRVVDLRRVRCSRRSA